MALGDGRDVRALHQWSRAAAALLCAALAVACDTPAAKSDDAAGPTPPPQPDPPPEPTELLYSLSRTGEPVVLIDKKTEASWTELLARFPALTDGKHATQLAQATNHFTRKFQYEVIEDPKAFEAAYRKTLASAGTDAPFDPRSTRLGDFGVPAFDEIHAPQHRDGRVIFFAKSQRLGVPYRAEIPLGAGMLGEATYEPLRMSTAAH